MRPNNLIDIIINHWPLQLDKTSTYTVGLSGGIDSVVLLHLLHQIQQTMPFQLTALHVNHAISTNASHWEEFCSALCNNLNIPLQIYRGNVVKKGGESLENAARQLRYTAYIDSPHPIIVLAHHNNDQVETILSQMLRGSNLHNIAAMHEVMQKQSKWFWRPLLTIDKKHIENYAQQLQLSYINDESNLDTKYLRNFVRHAILPQLNDWDNSINHKLLSLNKQICLTVNLLDEIAAEDLKHSQLADQNININTFKQLSPKRQTNLISYFIKQNNCPLPSHAQLNEFCNQACTAQWDRTPQLKLSQTAVLIKHKGAIYIQKN